MVASGGTINFSGKCHNIKLSMGEYALNSPMISIPIHGADVVLGVQWLQSLGTIDFNFQERFMKFSSEGKGVELRGIIRKQGKIISSNGMINLLKKEQRGVIAQLCSLEVPTLKSSISPDLQKVLDNHSKVFETPKGLPPIRDHDNVIHLIPGSVPPNIMPYRYPYSQRSEIERMVAEILGVGIIIQPNSINKARDEWKNDKAGWELIQKLQKILVQTILPELDKEGKSYWNLEQSQKQEHDSYKIDQFQSISSSGRTYPLKIPHGRTIILCRSIKNYLSIEDNTFSRTGAC